MRIGVKIFIGPHKKVWNIFTEILTSVGWSALRYAQKNKMVGDFHSNRFLYRCVLALQSFFLIVKIEKKISNMLKIWKKVAYYQKNANKFRWKSCTISVFLSSVWNDFIQPRFGVIAIELLFREVLYKNACLHIPGCWINGRKSYQMSSCYNYFDR